MAYITRNANLILLFCITLSLIILVLTTSFYQYKMSDINAEYNTKIAELRGVEKELNNKIRILDRVQKELKLKSEREESFAEQYTEVRSEKETLESERESLVSEKESLQDQLDDAIQDKNTAEAQAAFERRRSAELAEDLADAQDEAEYQEDRYDACQVQLAACQNT